MKSKLYILLAINIIIWICAALYYLITHTTATFLLGFSLTFSVSTLIGYWGSIQSLFISIGLAWGLVLLILIGGVNPIFVAVCALALTIGVILGHLIKTPV